MWKSCCAAVGSAAEIRDVWCRTAQVSRHCLQGCVTSGARCLARVTGPFSLVGQFHFSVGAGKLAAATPGTSCSKTVYSRAHVLLSTQSSLQTVNACSLRNNKWWEKLCLSQKLCVLSATEECPVMRFQLKGWERR